MVSRSLSEEEELELVIRYKIGASTLQLGERFGVHNVTVGRILDRHGVPRRTSQEPKTWVTPTRVAGLRATGQTWSEIASLLGCSITLVRNKWKESQVQ